METTIRLPQKGLAQEDILAQMQAFRGDDPNFKDAKTWSLVYYLDEEHSRFLKDAYGLYFSENGLNPMAFKSLRRFEHEVVRMTASMLNGDDQTVGVMTSGGTESCLLAVKTYRDLARAKKPWIRKPEMIVPESVHVAFEKGAEYFGVKAVHAPLGPDYRVDVRAVKRRINRNTILIVGSAPAYPHGVVDPIAELGELAVKKKLPLHVDSCLGGFLLPWVEKLGYTVPPFDFRVPGVMSISADIHKYGFAAKGASTLLYRSMDIMKHQLFVFENWPGGIFASPALLGTRPGGSIAAAWAALMHFGEEGYMQLAKQTMDTTRKLINGVNAIDGLEVLGQPNMSVFAFRSVDKSVGIYAVGDQMEARGWHIDRQHRPECLHAMVTPNHARIVDAYLSDLRESVDKVRKDPTLNERGGAATYGLISKVPLRGMIKKNVLNMMMQYYGPDGEQPDLDGDALPDDFATRAGQFFVRMMNRVGR